MYYNNKRVKIIYLVLPKQSYCFFIVVTMQFQLGEYAYAGDKSYPALSIGPKKKCVNTTSYKPKKQVCSSQT